MLRRRLANCKTSFCCVNLNQWKMKNEPHNTYIPYVSWVKPWWKRSYHPQRKTKFELHPPCGAIHVFGWRLWLVDEMHGCSFSPFINGKIDKKRSTTHTMGPTKALKYKRKKIKTNEGRVTSDFCGTSGVVDATSQRQLIEFYLFILRGIKY